MKINHPAFRPKPEVAPSTDTECPVDPSGEHKWASDEALALTKNFCVLCGHHP